MESKRRPGFSRVADSEGDSGQPLMHKSDNTGVGQSPFTSWGQVADKRTEAPPEVISNRRFAPLKGTKRHENAVTNPFASQTNPFSNINPTPNNTSLTQPQSNATPMASNISQASGNRGSATLPNGGIFQTHGSQGNSSSPFPSFNFGASTTDTPTFGNSSKSFQFGASQQPASSQQQPSQPSQFMFGQPKTSSPPIFSFGQETSATPPLFTFGQQQSNQPIFSFGKSQSAQQGSQLGQHATSQPPSFSLGLPQNDAQRSQSPSEQIGAPQNPFSLFSPQVSKTSEPAPSNGITQKSNLFGSNNSDSGSLFSFTKQHDEPAKTGFTFAAPGNTTEQQKQDGLNGLAQTAASPNLFTESQTQPNSKNNNGLFGSTQGSLARPGVALFEQSATGPGQQSMGSLFNQAAKKNSSDERSLTSQNTNTDDTVMSASPTKPLDRVDDNDTIMTSPSKPRSTNNISNETTQKSLSSEVSTSNSQPSQASALEPPIFGPVSFETGPFKNPFNFRSTSATISSDEPSNSTASKPEFSLNPNSFKVPAFTPPFSLKSDSNMASTSASTAELPNGGDKVAPSEPINRTAHSNSHQPNGPATRHESTRQVPTVNQPDNDTEDQVFSIALELRIFNRAFLKAFSQRDFTQDHSDMMRAYVSQVAKITNPQQPMKRKLSEDFDETAKKTKVNDERNQSVIETPGKSKTANLFASIISQTSTPSGGSANQFSPPKAGQADTNHTEPSGASGSSSNEATPAVSNLFSPSKPSSVFENSSTVASSTMSNATAMHTQSPLFAVSSNNPLDPETQQRPAGKSLFDRIGSTQKPISHFQNPFASLAQDGAADQTWKVDSPIKFGASQPTPSFLHPGQNHASPGTSRATTPGTGDGGITSEAESVISNAGEGNDTDQTSETENPAQAQVDLTTEDPSQQILFETEKAKAMTRNTSDKTWETRGVGPIRILKHSETGWITVLMRLSPSGKVLLHTALVTGLSYTAQGTGAVLPVASEGGKLDSWFIRFKTKDLAEAFADKCEELKVA